jgi:AI-2 transport protein TqsA
MASRAIDSFGSTILGQVSGIVKAVVTTTGSVLAGIVLVFFLTLLMLIEAPLWRKKLSSIASSYTAQDTEDTLNVVAYRLRRYLLTRTVLGLLTALLYVLWLWIFGVDLLLVWFLLTFLLNYIPTIGSLISGGLAIIYAYVQKDFGSATLVAAGLLAIEQIMGNYIDPRVQGRQVSVSPLIILFVLLLWGWIWGVAGALLAVPITIAVIIISAHVAPLRPLGLLLSNEKDMDGLDRIAQPDAQKD